MAFLVVLFVRPQDTLPFLAPLHLADITGGMALVALFIGRANRGAAILTSSPTLTAVLGFGFLMLATAPFSIWPGGSISVFTEVFSKIMLIFAVLVNTVTTRRRLEATINIIVIGTSYIALRAVFDYARGVNLVEGGRVTGAVGGLFGNPNDMALNMVAFLPLAIVVALGVGTTFMRGLALLGVPAIALAIVFSKSRGGTVGLAAMLLVFLYQLRRLRPGVAVLIVVGSLAAVPLLPQSFTDRMSSILNPDADPTGSREARKRAMREAYQTYLENPLIGVGAGQFENYMPDDREEAWRETHNAVLQVAAEMGTIGLVVFAFIVGSGFAAAVVAGARLRAKGRRSRARRPPPIGESRVTLELFAAALVASLAGWLVASMFASVAYYWTLYLVLGLAIALRNITQRYTALGAASLGKPSALRAA
jgi:O-antigen ligase